MLKDLGSFVRIINTSNKSIFIKTAAGNTKNGVRLNLLGVLMVKLLFK